MQAIEPWSGYYGGGGGADMPVVWAMAHVTQFAKLGWRYLQNGFGSGELPKGGYFTTMVDPKGGDFSLFVVKNSYDHAACTRPALPPTEVSEPENVTFILSPSIHGGGGGSTNITRLACWRSNFELETSILFEQQPDIVVDAATGSFSLALIDGDYYTVSTVRTATHGKAATPVPPSQPRHPIPVVDDFDGYARTSRQPRLWSQMTGSWEVQLDAANTSNKVLRQEATDIPHSSWAGRFTFFPGTVLGMREWQDVHITAKFRLPTTSFGPNWPAETAGVCVATRTSWVFRNGIFFCISANGVWSLTYSAPSFKGGTIMNGTVANPPKGDAGGSWHTLTLATMQGVASGSYDGAFLFANTTVRNIDTGFAALGATGYYAVEFDEVAVNPVGPHWDPNPAPPKGCNASPPAVGQVLHVRHCETNGIAADDQAFDLIAQSWQIRHRSSQYCATAVAGGVGAEVTLQVCNFTDPLQMWQNDYSNIHHGNVPMTLVEANVTLSARTDGSVATGNVYGKGKHPKNNTEWATWTYFDSTHQLRNTRNPVPGYPYPDGYPMCLSLCR